MIKTTLLEITYNKMYSNRGRGLPQNKIYNTDNKMRSGSEMCGRFVKFC